MAHTDLQQLLADGESESIEFVARVDHEERIADVACAFLNAGGGTIVVGAKDNGRHTGIADAPTKAPILQQHLLAALSPTPALSVIVEKVADQAFLVVDVPQGLAKPYVCNGKIMVRRGTTVALANNHEVSALIGQRAATEQRWERLPALGFEEDDFDTALIQRVAATISQRRGTVVARGSPLEVLGQLGLVQGGLFTNAAVVLFGRKPTEWYPQTRVRAARFRNDERTEFLDNQVFEGNLFALLDSLLRFVQQHTPVVARLDAAALQRREQPAYPLAAVREALVNALVHRDYSAFDGGVSVAVLNDRVEIWNSGRLPDAMTVADLRHTHPSRPRNPDIAQVCFLYGYMERWGIGTQRIIQACVENGLPEPEWQVDQQGLTLTLRSSVPAEVPATSDLNIRLLNVARRLRPGRQLKLTDYRRLVADEVKERQARSDLSQLTDAGYLQRIGAGPATVYIRTAKPVPDIFDAPK